jgi:hypothetical protein
MTSREVIYATEEVAETYSEEPTSYDQHSVGSSAGVHEVTNASALADGDKHRRLMMCMGTLSADTASGEAVEESDLSCSDDFSQESAAEESSMRYSCRGQFRDKSSEDIGAGVWQWLFCTADDGDLSTAGSDELENGYSTDTGGKANECATEDEDQKVAADPDMGATPGWPCGCCRKAIIGSEAEPPPPESDPSVLGFEAEPPPLLAEPPLPPPIPRQNHHHLLGGKRETPDMNLETSSGSTCVPSAFEDREPAIEFTNPLPPSPSSGHSADFTAASEPAIRVTNHKSIRFSSGYNANATVAPILARQPAVVQQVCYSPIGACTLVAGMSTVLDFDEYIHSQTGTVASI